MKSAALIPLLATFFATPSKGASDAFTGLDFLVGSWTASTAGTTGSDVFERDLNGYVLKRHSHSESTDRRGDIPTQPPS